MNYYSDDSDEEIVKNKKQKIDNISILETRKRRNSEGDLYNIRIKERCRYDDYFKTQNRNKQIELLGVLKSKKTGYNCFYGIEQIIEDLTS